MQKYAIKFVTTCKSRLTHLQETLPLLSEQAKQDIVVVDYSCPQKSGEWVEKYYPQAHVVRVNNDGFNVSDARNQGARDLNCDFICFIDADVKVSPGFLDWLNEHLNPYCFYTIAKTNGPNELWGTTIVPTNAYKIIRGYDELFSGWGGEDDDFYYRLKIAGFSQQEMPAHFFESIKHDDAQRTQFYQIKDKTKQFYIIIISLFSIIAFTQLYFFRTDGAAFRFKPFYKFFF
jgi:glycosyltransferase involved in cell wall biosynthesis